MDMLNKALVLAFNAHKGQVDKAGVDYILHPIYVALNMDTEYEKITALLHDVIEDTAITLDELSNYGFKKEIIDAVNLLTKDKETDYFEYLKVLKNNELALKVKLADLKHNLDDERLSKLGEKGNALSLKYKKAIDFLTK